MDGGPQSPESCEAEAQELRKELKRAFAAGGSAVLSLQHRLAYTLCGKGSALEGLDRDAEAIKTYDQITELFGNASEPVLITHVLEALRGKASVLLKTGERDNATSALRDAIGRATNVVDLEVQSVAADASLHLARILMEAGRREDALAALIEQFSRFQRLETELRAVVISGFARWDWDSLQDAVATGLRERALLSHALGRTEEAIETLDCMASRFGKDDDDSHCAVAKGILDKARILAEVGKNEKAATALEELVRRFGGAKSSDIQQTVELALRDQAKTR